MAVTLFFTVGCSDKNIMQFCELGIVLPSDFTEYDSSDSFDLSYSDGLMIVGFTRVSFVAAMDDGIPTTLTPMKFAELYRARTDLEEYELFEHGDVVYLEYSLESEHGGVYHYMPTFYVTPYAYFVIMFIYSESQSYWDKDSILYLTDSVFIDMSTMK